MCIARCMLWPGVRLYVTRRYCIEMAERIELLFYAEGTLSLSYTVIYGIRVSSKLRYR